MEILLLFKIIKIFKINCLVVVKKIVIVITGMLVIYVIV